MKRETIEKCAVTLVLVACWLFLPAVGYTNGDDANIKVHLLYIVSHANIWHLAGNLLCLWLIRRELYLYSSLAIAILTSYIPAFSIYGDMGVTLGFSGVLFAIVGTKWGLYIGEWSRQGATPMVRKYAGQFMMKILPFAIVGIIIPHVNWCLHTYCLLEGFGYGWLMRFTHGCWR